MIRQVSIRNFKSLRDVRIDLDRFTVFVGPNASGKSSILQGINLLCRSFQLQAESIEHDLFQGFSRAAEDGVELVAESGDECYRYRSKSFSSGTRPAPSAPAAPTQQVSADLNSTQWKPWQGAAGSSPPLPRSVLLRLEASKLIPPSVNPADQTGMAPDGTGIHPALASMALNDPDSWQRLQTDLRRIIPTIRRLRHAKVPPGQVPPLLFDTLGADSLQANQVSEGTLLVLGLLTALHAPDRPNFVLLDDLDRGLHPKAQKELIALLRGLLDTNASLQIAATTHSPYLLDCMQPNEVRMTTLREDGSTVCASIEKHPKFDKWKDEMAPGEMWSLFGEKWLAGAGAAS